MEIPGLTRFRDEPGGLISVEIDSPLCSGKVYLHGAHVAEWTPAGHEPVLFTSAASHFAPGKAIRGGVPICFPWFAARAGFPKAPAHGFVRTAQWNLDSLSAKPDGAVEAVFSIRDSEATREQWPHGFRAIFRASFGTSLEMALEVENTGSESFVYEEALHTYFRIADIHAISITGLEGAEYVDKTDSGARKAAPVDALRFTSETDRVFHGSTGTCTLHDPGLGREIAVGKTGSRTTVVWNPWIAKAAAMADFGDEEWPGMACIETANSGEDAVSLAPGATHTMTARIEVRRV